MSATEELCTLWEETIILLYFAGWNFVNRFF